MTRVIIMSDSHGYDESIDCVLKRYPLADAYIHAGDFCSYSEKYPQILFVKGNNDYYDDFPFFRILKFNNTGIYVCHSHRLPAFNRTNELVRLAKDHNCRIAVYGHTHIYDDRTVKNIRILNPGSLWHNRDGNKPGYLVLDIYDDKFEVKREFLD